MDRRRDEYVHYVQRMIESLDKYSGESERRLYHVGFLTGFLVKLFQRDPFLLREFESQIEQLQQEKKKRKRG